MKDFNLQDLANTAWALAKLGHKDEQLFKSLAATAHRRMEDLEWADNWQDLANTAWALTDSAACTLGS